MSRVTATVTITPVGISPAEITVDWLVNNVLLVGQAPEEVSIMDVGDKTLTFQLLSTSADKDVETHVENLKDDLMSALDEAADDEKIKRYKITARGTSSFDVRQAAMLRRKLTRRLGGRKKSRTYRVRIKRS
jgi:hypothetical protein